MAQGVGSLGLLDCRNSQLPTPQFNHQQKSEVTRVILSSLICHLFVLGGLCCVPPDTGKNHKIDIHILD